MKKFTLLLLSISSLITTSFGKHFTVEDSEMKAIWSEWKKKYNKIYDEHEEAAKMSTFVDNYNMIKKFNADPDNTATLEINQFADLTEEEFAAQYLDSQPDSHPGKNSVEEEDKRFLAPSTALPSSAEKSN